MSHLNWVAVSRMSTFTCHLCLTLPLALIMDLIVPYNIVYSYRHLLLSQPHHNVLFDYFDLSDFSCRSPPTFRISTDLGASFIYFSFHAAHGASRQEYEVACHSSSSWHTCQTSHCLLYPAAGLVSPDSVLVRLDCPVFSKNCLPDALFAHLPSRFLAWRSISSWLLR